MNCIIVDDDNTALLTIKRCVEMTDYLDLKGTFKSPVEARNSIKNDQLDLIFLDVEMPVMSGLELIKSLDKQPQIILISSKKDYAYEAFELNVTDYIQKPVEYPRFLQAVEKAMNNIGNVTNVDKDQEHIFVKADSMLVRLNLDEVKYIEAMGDYIRIYTQKQRLTVLSTMKAFEEKLPVDRFLRIHKSYIVALNKIEAINGNSIPFNDKLIPISKSYKNSLMEKINLI